jgi:hypothetical protein
VDQSARIVRRELQHHENLATGECAWFGMIEAAIPYEFEVALARKELARRRAKWTQEQIAKEVRRIQCMVRLKHTPHEFSAHAGPQRRRDEAAATLARMTEASVQMDPYRYEEFCHTFWYPGEGNFRPESPDSLAVLVRRNSQEGWQPPPDRVNIAERTVQHRENLDTGAAAWFGVVIAENPTAWAVAREIRRLDARRAKLTEKQIARAERAIERLKREPFEPPAFGHHAGPYRERDQAVAAIAQMVEAAKVMTPEQHDEFCRGFWRTANSVGGW